MIRLLACLAVLAAAPGCGIKGDLDQPGPLWGDTARAKPDAPRPEADTPPDENQLFRNRRPAAAPAVEPTPAPAAEEAADGDSDSDSDG